MADESVKPEANNETPTAAAAALAASPTAARADEEAAAAEATAALDTEPMRQAPPPVQPEAKRSGSRWPWLLLALLIVAGAAGWFTRDKWLPHTGLALNQDRRPAADEAHPATSTPPPSPVTAAPSTPAASAPSPSAPAISAPTAAPTAAVAMDALASYQKQLADDVNALDRRVAAIEQTVNEVQKAVERLVAAADDNKGLTGAVTALDERLARLERSAIQTGALESQVRELSAKALTLREGFASLNSSVLAVSQLGQAVSEGTPFGRELAAVRSLAGNDQAIADALKTLEPFAASGVPTTAALTARFPMVADAIARAAPTSGGDTWIDRVVDKFASLVSIRVTGPAAARAGGIDGVLAEAEAMLKAGDLASAVGVVNRIEGQAAIPAAEWLRAAESRLAANGAVSTLEAEAAARLAKARG
ncbi:MAG: mitofilin family membrane protein [Rhodospirillales bacterium]